MPKTPLFFWLTARGDFDLTNPLVFVVIVLFLVFVIIPFTKFVVEMISGRRWRW